MTDVIRYDKLVRDKIPSMAVIRKNAGNSGAEDRFIEIFCDTFGAEKGQYVYLQYPIATLTKRQQRGRGLRMA